jgi:hypothetical protein
MAREIVLSNGMKCLVDDADFEWLSKWKWTATYFCRGKGERTDKTKWYAARWECTSEYYTVRKGPRKGKKRKKQQKKYMHREIAGTRSHHVTDHINGNGLDNQRHNLRNCSQKTNCQNKKIDGVVWD